MLGLKINIKKGRNKMKKLMGIILALAMLVSVMGTLCVSAATLSENAPKLNVDFMENGGFEEVDENGYPVGVEAYKGWEGGHAVYETEDVHSGNGALRVQTDVWGHDPWANVQVPNLVGGCTVELSFWYKLQMPKPEGQNEKAHFGIKIEGYIYDHIRSDYGAGQAWADVTYENADEWTHTTVEYTLHEKATMVAFYFRLYGMDSGYVIVDDVEMKVTALPNISFESMTDQVFYYTDYEGSTGYAEVTMNQNFVDEGYKADFRFLDDGKQVDGVKDVRFNENYKARFTYPLSHIKVKQKEYIIEIDVKEPGGAILQSFKHYVYRYDRPKALSKDGIYTDKNGKVVHPVFNYHMSAWDDVEARDAAQAAGINVIQMTLDGGIAAATARLDELYERGMYAAIVCYYGMLPAGHDQNWQRVYNDMIQIKDHPAVFCWMAMDEPFIQDVHNHDNMRKSYIMLRSINDHTPVYICEGMQSHMKAAANYCDILGPDPYPAQWNSYGTFVPMVVDMAATEARIQGNKLALGILQCCTIGTLPEATPTALKIHSMIMQNYMAGAKGHGWYAWEPDRPDIDPPLNEGAYWDMLMKFKELESDLIFKYFILGEYKNFNMEKQGDLYAQTGDTWYETFTDGEVLYGIAQNRQGEAKTAVVSLTSTNGKVTIGDYDYEVIYDGEGVSKMEQRDGAIAITLEPYQAMTFKVTPKQAVDFSVLTAMTDLEGYDWALDAINFLYDNGIEDKGSYSFAPGEPITRGDFAKFLIRTLGLDEKVPGENFADVDITAPYAKEVAIGKTMMILNGVGDNNYMPEEGISRQDLMAICGRGMRYAKPFNAKSTDLSKYPDGDKVAGYAVKDVAAMLESGIIKGNEKGEINPLGNTTRAEAAVIMQRIYNWMNEK